MTYHEVSNNKLRKNFDYSKYKGRRNEKNLKLGIAILFLFFPSQIKRRLILEILKSAWDLKVLLITNHFIKITLQKHNKLTSQIAMIRNVLRCLNEAKYGPPPERPKFK